MNNNKDNKFVTQRLEKHCLEAVVMSLSSRLRVIKNMVKGILYYYYINVAKGLTLVLLSQPFPSSLCVDYLYSSPTVVAGVLDLRPLDRPLVM